MFGDYCFEGNLQIWIFGRVCSSAGRAAISKVAGRGFESLRTRLDAKGNMENERQDKDNMSVTHKSGLFAESKKRAQAALKRKNREGFLQGLKDELKKVSWTTREELRLSTKVVIMATFVLGLGIYFADLVIKGCLDLIALTAQAIFG